MKLGIGINLVIAYIAFQIKTVLLREISAMLMKMALAPLIARPS